MTVPSEMKALLLTGDGYTRTQTGSVRRFRDRRGPGTLEAQTRFSDDRWSTAVKAIVPLAEAMAWIRAEPAKRSGKVFLRPSVSLTG